MSLNSLRVCYVKEFINIENTKSQNRLNIMQSYFHTFLNQNITDVLQLLILYMNQDNLSPEEKAALAQMVKQHSLNRSQFFFCSFPFHFVFFFRGKILYAFVILYLSLAGRILQFKFVYFSKYQFFFFGTNEIEIYTRGNI